MATLQFFCPATNQQASTGIETDPDSLTQTAFAHVGLQP